MDNVQKQSLIVACVKEVPSSNLGRDITIISELLCGFPQSLQENGGMMYEIRPELFAFTTYPIHDSLITPSFDAK
jgi:hypothetical protein